MKLHPVSLAVLVLWIGLAPFGSASASQRRTAVVDAVQRVRAAVVNIHSERTAALTNTELLPHALSQNRVNGMGTGIIIDPRGYIVTNHHVVEDVNLLRVRLNDGTTASARVVGRDAAEDLALLKIDVNKPLPVIPLGTANDLMVGETVVAIGNAYGYEHSVTVGVVSATKRDVSLNKEVSYKALIQTDASINPGNSGGPLLNIDGELVGVNVAIRAGAQGIGFAIPVDTMIRVTANMLNHSRKGDTLWTGLGCRDVVGEDDGKPEAQTVASGAGAAPRRTLVVEQVEAASPAARAGLQRGDVLVRVGDLPVRCSLELERALLEANPGEKLTVAVRRGNQEQKLELAPQAPQRPGAGPAEVVWRKLGVRLAGVNTETVTRVNPQLHGGMAVVELRSDSLAARSGIQRGDVLVGINKWETLTLDNVLYVLQRPDLASLNPVEFYIIRAGQVHRGFLQID